MFVLCYAEPKGWVSQDKPIKSVLHCKDDEKGQEEPDTECVGGRKTLHEICPLTFFFPERNMA